MSAPAMNQAPASGRQARSRRLAILLALLAACFYAGFIILGALTAGR